MGKICHTIEERIQINQLFVKKLICSRKKEIEIKMNYNIVLIKMFLFNIPIIKTDAN